MVFVDSKLRHVFQLQCRSLRVDVWVVLWSILEAIKLIETIIVTSAQIVKVTWRRWSRRVRVACLASSIRKNLRKSSSLASCEAYLVTSRRARTQGPVAWCHLLKRRCTCRLKCETMALYLFRMEAHHLRLPQIKRIRCQCNRFIYRE